MQAKQHHDNMCTKSDLLPGPVGVELVPDLLLRESPRRQAGNSLVAGRTEGAHTDRAVLDAEEARRGEELLPARGVLALLGLVHRVGDHAGVGGDGQGPEHQC